jgi:hypothetical protein
MLFNSSCHYNHQQPRLSGYPRSHKNNIPLQSRQPNPDEVMLKPIEGFQLQLYRQKHHESTGAFTEALEKPGIY